MNQLRNNSESYKNLYILLPYLALVIIHILLTLPMKVPLIWPDEFAYLFFGKYIAGLENVQNIPKIELTGSFGYSVLFSPVFWFVHSPQKAYSIILIMNSILGSTLYIGLFLLLKNLFNSKPNQSAWISFLISLYPAYLLQTDVVLTDAITPACFVWGVVLFHKFIKNQNILYGVLFGLIAGYLNWIHIRMLPFTIISIFFLSALIYYKRMPIFSTGLSIVTMVIMVLLGIIIGDHLTYAISGAIEKSQRISVSLIQVAEIIFIFFLLGSSVYLTLKKYYLLMIYTIAGLLAGVLTSTSFTMLWIFPVSGIILLLILKSSNKISLKYGITAFSILTFVTAFTYFVLPDFGYYTVVSERIMIWFVNASGSLFYALFSTYGLFLIGAVFVILQMREDSIIQVPAVNHTDLFKEEMKSQFSFFKLLNNEVSLTLLFMMASAFLMIFITIFPSKLQVTHYRADHLFYGRYVEVVIAAFMAIGVLKLIHSEAKDFLISTLSVWVIFIILTFVMILTYDNIIPSELSFRSVLSFFPLRAILGNINVMLYFIASIIVSIVASFAFRYNALLGKIVIGMAFVSFSIFTYIYVNYYHQIEKQQRNKLIHYLDDNYPDKKFISYDTKIFNENSQNGLSYLWLMNDKKIDFINSSSKTKKPKSDLIISNSSYGVIDNNSAILLNIEHDGNDHLWLDMDDKPDSLRWTLMPSFYNIPLNKKYVSGVLRSGFYNDKWINGKAEIITNVNKPDSVFNIEIELGSSSSIPQNLIIWLENKELFNQNVAGGGWRYTLTVKADTIMKKLHFKFFSDLTKDKSNKNKLKGISINSFVIKSNITKKSQDLKLESLESNNNFDEIDYDIYPRRNIDMSQINFEINDTISLPFVIKNNGQNSIIFNDDDPVYLTYNWSDFVFKSSKKEFSGKQLKGIIKPGEEFEVQLKIISPNEAKKYFLSFNLLSKKHVIIKPKYKREYLYNLKYF